MQDPSSIMIAPSVVVDSGSSVLAVGVVPSSRGSSGSPVAVTPGGGVVTSGVAVLLVFVGSFTGAPAVAVVSTGFSVSATGFGVVTVADGTEGVVTFTSGASVVLPVKKSMMVVKSDGDSVLSGAGVAFFPSTGSTVEPPGVVASSSRGSSGSADVTAVEASVVVV